jgi:hypothetical protein
MISFETISYVCQLFVSARASFKGDSWIAGELRRWP